LILENIPNTHKAASRVQSERRRAKPSSENGHEVKLLPRASLDKVRGKQTLTNMSALGSRSRSISEVEPNNQVNNFSKSKPASRVSTDEKTINSSRVFRLEENSKRGKKKELMTTPKKSGLEDEGNSAIQSNTSPNNPNRFSHAKQHRKKLIKSISLSSVNKPQSTKDTGTEFEIIVHQTDSDGSDDSLRKSKRSLSQSKKLPL